MEVIDLRRIDAFQQPFLLFHFVYTILAAYFAAAEPEIKSIFLVFGDLVFTECVNPHLAGAVLPFGNLSVEGKIFPGVVFRLHGEPFYARVRWEAFWYCP